MIVDAHQHFWKYDPIQHGWINEEMKILKRDFLPNDLLSVFQSNKIDGCVAVQADQSENETEFLLRLSNEYSFIKGVVGWVDFRSNKISERLDFFSSQKKTKGFRHIVQSEPKGFLLQKDFLRGITELAKYNFTYDILVYHYQLNDAIEFVKHFPDQKFVVDHLAKPNIKQNLFSDWSKGISALAQFENVSCKISGFTTEANWNNWKPSDFEPYFNFILEKFGANRLLYGSDWPVCVLAASYEQQLHLVENFLSPLSESEKQKIFSENAINFYNL